MENQNLVVLNGVNAYLGEDNLIYLAIEDVARGLGFTQMKNEKEYVRWDRVEEYLRDLSFPTCGENNYFIPENIFYKLCMKANNETARKFQDLVCDKILPEIRKTGSYQSKAKLPQTYKEALLELVAQVEENEKLQLENKTLNHSLHYKQDIIDGMTNSVPVYEKQHILSRVVKHKGSNFQQRWSEIYKVFQETHHVNLKARKEGYNKTHSPKIKSTLQYAVNTGYLDALYDIAMKLYETDMNEIIASLHQ
ncbi:hypothetical protein C4N15_07340 [Fusobacterium necrophorum subsp. funduliforme]|uniref:BRO-N domain-containing protein n=1 Tax=Fusobacterium necrophorum TaxID=859 RepID=UPI000245DAD4|nr:BRO family protein [Fusobacterium necrophorum]AVQ21471.1 hypothetical protein C4N15_07340 [Fusobacterium necrophorum subsp. funduliforme]EHO19639.1 hypothetical protein HMPREF9466_01570 [Fusobacterium necrophorum subsp. funduliforme 1_1_36S]